MNDYQRLKIEYVKVTNQRRQTKPQVHDYFELYYLKGGRTTYNVGDKIFVLKPSDFIMVPKGVIHSNDSESCLHNERILITFSSDVLDSAIKPYVTELSDCKYIHIPENKQYIFEEILLKVLKERDVTLKRIYVFELLVLLCRHKSDNTETANGIIEQVSEYIRENYDSQITLSSLAYTFSVSESHLSRKFKSVTGLGVSEYLTQVRVYNAQHLLRQGLSITEVSDACGFSDSNYFATVFKKITGTTPYKYKKMQF